jgi:hypothetical protein
VLWGTVFTLERVAAVEGMTATAVTEALEPAVKFGLVQLAPPTGRFTHDSVQVRPSC